MATPASRSKAGAKKKIHDTDDAYQAIEDNSTIIVQIMRLQAAIRRGDMGANAADPHV